jgi:hypothetical protein
MVETSTGMTRCSASSREMVEISTTGKDVGHLDGNDESVCTLQTDVCSTVYMHSTSPLLPW